MHVGLVYQGNPKHKEPWQRGRRGSLCPKHANAETLLRTSLPDPKKPTRRYATDGREAYEAKPRNTVDANGDDVWHGFPIPWSRVPPSVQRTWISAGLLPRYQM